LKNDKNIWGQRNIWGQSKNSSYVFILKKWLPGRAGLRRRADPILEHSPALQDMRRIVVVVCGGVGVTVEKLQEWTMSFPPDM